LLYSFLCHASRPPPDLPSFPTRRSSDLPSVWRRTRAMRCAVQPSHRAGRGGGPVDDSSAANPSRIACVSVPTTWFVPCVTVTGRSEEHTSELQSRFDIVCRLLLEKKKPK